jgi:hypothetical protein
MKYLKIFHLKLIDAKTIEIAEIREIKEKETFTEVNL